MKEHDYLDLNIGDIGQYAMIVNKKELENWKKKGWLTYEEVHLPEGDENAAMLYGKLNKKTETLLFNRPTLLRDSIKEEITGRKIISVSTHLGTYGMGGAGFFGILLDHREFLTYAVWGAGRYVVIDNRMVECDPEFYPTTKPWMSDFGGDQTWDDLTDYITGSTIIDYQFTPDLFRMKAEKNGQTIHIEFVRNDKRLPGKSGKVKNAYKRGEISDYILFQHEEGVLIV